MPYRDMQAQKEAQKRHYEKNKEVFARRQWTQRNKVSRFITESKVGKACVCGESHTACLDFHHVNPADKVATVAVMRRDKWTLEQVQVELAKCVLMCANCHRKHHYNSRTGPYTYDSGNS